MKTIPFRKIIPAVLATVMLASMTACGDDDPTPGGTVYPSVVNMVTLSEYVPSGGMVFTFRKGEVTPVITLTTPLRFDTAHVHQGDRLMIGYNIPDARPDSISGPIELINYRTIFNGAVVAASQTVVSTYPAAPVSQLQVWRTGNYLNAMGMIPYYGNPLPVLQLYADEASAKDGSINMYVTLDKLETPPAQQIDTYSSFDLCPFLEAHPGISTLRVYYTGCQGTPVIFSNVYPLPE